MNSFRDKLEPFFLRYILREPSTEEIIKYLSLYKADLNYQNLQKAILLLPEYVGN